MLSHPCYFFFHFLKEGKWSPLVVGLYGNKAEKVVESGRSINHLRALKDCDGMTSPLNPLTSAVWDWIVPASSFQAVEAGRANQLIAVVAAKNNLTAHQKVPAISVTELWIPRVLAFHWLW